MSADRSQPAIKQQTQPLVTMRNNVPGGEVTEITCLFCFSDQPAEWQRQAVLLKPGDEITLRAQTKGRCVAIAITAFAATTPDTLGSARTPGPIAHDQSWEKWVFSTSELAISG